MGLDYYDKHTRRMAPTRMFRIADAMLGVLIASTVILYMQVFHPPFSIRKQAPTPDEPVCDITFERNLFRAMPGTRCSRMQVPPGSHPAKCEELVLEQTRRPAPSDLAISFAESDAARAKADAKAELAARGPGSFRMSDLIRREQEASSTLKRLTQEKQDAEWRAGLSWDGGTNSVVWCEN